MPSVSFVEAIVLTLLHSLWQGGILAFFAALTVVFTRRCDVRYRYYGLLALLGLFVAGILLTFYVVWYGGIGLQVTGQMAFIDAHAGVIAALWAGCLLVRLAFIGLELYGLGRLRQVGTSPVEAKWSMSVQRLAYRMGIDRTISLLESAVVRVPMVIGHFKPVVLVPLGLITHLPPNEMEAILIHELAHIRRRDFVINLIVQGVQAVLFFNPAIWWVTHLIGEERENCCDELAVGVAGNRLDYVRTLVQFAERFHGPVKLAQAFPGTGNGLLTRVERLARGRNRQMSKLESLILVILLTLSTWLTTLSYNTHRSSVLPLTTVARQMAAKKQAEAVALRRLQANIP